MAHRLPLREIERDGRKQEGRPSTSGATKTKQFDRRRTMKYIVLANIGWIVMLAAVFGKSVWGKSVW